MNTNEKCARLMRWLPFQLVEGGDRFRGALGDDPAYPIGLPDFQNDIAAAHILDDYAYKEKGLSITIEREASGLFLAHYYAYGMRKFVAYMDTDDAKETEAEARCAAFIAAMEKDDE